MLKTRLYERDLDAIFIRSFQSNPDFVEGLLKCIGIGKHSSMPTVNGQTEHVGNSGTIDIDAKWPNGTRLLIENKIDAGWSHTSDGIPQPERYKVSGQRLDAITVLLAPAKYLTRSAGASEFDVRLSYENVAEFLSGDDLIAVWRAVAQAMDPPEGETNALSSDFFTAFARVVEEVAPDLKMNQRKDRKSGSHTAHFKPGETFILRPDLPKPSLFLQFREANVKLLLRGWARYLETLSPIADLRGTGFYLRRAGLSLGVVNDSPRLDTQAPFEPQLDKALAAIEATRKLRNWWNENPETIRAWAEHVASCEN